MTTDNEQILFTLRLAMQILFERQRLINVKLTEEETEDAWASFSSLLQQVANHCPEALPGAYRKLLKNVKLD